MAAAVDLRTQQRQEQEATWQKMLQSLNDWTLSHNNNNNDARGPTSKENPFLASWIREQRRNFADFFKLQNNDNSNNNNPQFCSNGGTFTQGHIEQLNAIGFDWRETEFDVMFRQLENFKLTHGNGSCNVPDNYADAELVRWVQVQRENKHRLDAIGFEWQDDENTNPNCNLQQNNDQEQPFPQQTTPKQQHGFVVKRNQEQLQQQQLQLQQNQQQEQIKKESQPNEQSNNVKGNTLEQPSCANQGSLVQGNSKDGGCEENSRSDTTEAEEQLPKSDNNTNNNKKRKKSIHNIDLQQFAHLSGYSKKNAIRSAIRAEEKRRKEMKRKKIVLFADDEEEDSVEYAGGNGNGNCGDGQMGDDHESIKIGKQQKFEEKVSDAEAVADDVSADSLSSDDEEELPDYDLDALLSEEEEEEEGDEQSSSSCMVQQKNWDAMFAKLVCFRKKYGHGYVQNKHPDLALVRWCDEQRKRIKHARITKAEMHRLEAVGFHKVVYKSNFYWNQMFRGLGELQKKAGIRVTTKLLSREKHPHAVRFIEWMGRQNQARKKGLLSQKRIDKLDAIGFEWATLTPAEKWGSMFTKLCAFKQEYGHCRVPQDFCIKSKQQRQGKKERLGEWVHYHRKRHNLGKVSEEKVKRLNDIGFDWVGDRRLAQLGIKSGV